INQGGQEDRLISRKEVLKMQGIGSVAPMDLSINPSSQGFKGGSAAKADSPKAEQNPKTEKNPESFDQSLSRVSKEESQSKAKQGQSAQSEKPVEKAAQQRKATDGQPMIEQKVALTPAT